MTVVPDSWSVSDIEVLARAVVAAPSIHDTQPWNLRLSGRSADLIERTEFADPVHDPLRLDRIMSCGSAVANLELGMRALGWRTETSLLPDPERPELIATVRAVDVASPSSTDLRYYAAISQRRSHREFFADIPVPDATIADIIGAARCAGVHVRLLAADEAGVLADVLTYSATLVRQNPHYQREMFSWTSHWQPGGNGEVVADWGPDTDASGDLAGRALVTTALPDTALLAAAIDLESVLVFTVDTETPLDLIRAGIASERAWLAAVDARLSASVLTHPLRVEDSAARFARRLQLPGYPQMLMRVGY